MEILSEIKNKEELETIFKVLNFINNLLFESYEISADLLKEEGVTLSESLLIKEAYDLHFDNFIELVSDELGISFVEKHDESVDIDDADWSLNLN